MLYRTVYLRLPPDLFEKIEDARGGMISMNKMCEHLLRLGLQSEWRLPVHQPAETKRTRRVKGDGLHDNP